MPHATPGEGLSVRAPDGNPRPQEAAGEAAPALSVVVPVHNEAGNVAPLVAEIARALDGRLTYEIVYVDDGSTDGTARALAEMAVPELRALRLRRPCGQSAAIRAGVRAARAPWVVTLDGDGQNDPADIPAMLAARDGAAAKAVLVAGVRAKRRDTLAKRWASRLANRLRGWLLRDRARDTGCGLKLFPRAAFLELPQFDHMHRFLPALFAAAGVTLVELPVNHRPRSKGRSHYGIVDRGLVGLVDLFGVAWLQRRTTRPIIESEDRHD
jgi:dolichol-phosphate mannosyltransferase